MERIVELEGTLSKTFMEITRPSVRLFNCLDRYF